MLKIITGFLVCMLLSCSCLAATAYVNGQWYIDGQFEQQTWYAVDGRFSARKPAHIGNVVDLKGGYALPPLAEAHNHNLQNPFLANRFAESYIESGILYGLMMCGSHGNADKTRAVLADKGLDVKVAGACISSSDGHPLRMAMGPEPGSKPRKPEEIRDKSYIVIDSLEDIHIKWPLIQQGADDVVKLIMVHSEKADRRGNEEYFGINGLRPEIIEPLINRIHRHGLRAAVHVDSAADFATAVDAGADIIAHLPGYRWEEGYQPDDYRLTTKTIQRAVKNEVTVIATASVTDMIYLKYPKKHEEVKALQRQNLKQLRDAGVSVVIGSDRFFGANVIDEVLYLSELGVYDQPSLLKMLVEDTPLVIHPNRKLGAIKEGYEASFIVVERDPLKDLDALRNVRLLIRQGETLLQK